jgi:elongation factor G
MMEDPTLRVHQDEDTGQTLLSGMGELHLEVIISRMKREFNTRVNVGKPQVVYRETINTAGVGKAEFDKEIAGQHHFGGVELELAPLARGSEFIFRSEINEEELPQNLIPAIENGIREALETGPLMGYPAVDVSAVLKAVTYKESHGTELAFKVSSAMAVREALNAGQPFLLEPIMTVEVFVPEDFTGEVIGDLNARGGKIGAIEHRTGVQVVQAEVPLAKMFGYSTALRSATQGRGTFTMQFSHFDRS